MIRNFLSEKKPEKTVLKGFSQNACVFQKIEIFPQNVLNECVKRWGH